MTWRFGCMKTAHDDGIMSNANNAASASQPQSLPGVSGQQAVKFIIGALGRIVHPSLLPDIARAAAHEAGISIDPFLTDLPCAKAEPASAKRGGKKKDDHDAAHGNRGRVNPYTLFITKAMQKIKEDPQYHSAAVSSDGKPIRAMAMAAALWKGMSDETREAFSKAYQPLCDQLKVERGESGLKPDNLKARIQAHEATFPPVTRNLLKSVLPDKLPSAVLATATTGSGALLGPEQPSRHAPLVASSSKDSSDDDDDDDDNEDSEDEGAAAAEARRQAEEEARRQAEEEAARKAEAEEQERKKAKKEKKAKSKAAAAAAIETAAADGKSAKRKHKGHAKENGTTEHGKVQKTAA